MEDANRFTAQQQQKTTRAGLDAFSKQENKKSTPADTVQGSEATVAILDTLPVEIEVRRGVYSAFALLTSLPCRSIRVGF
jgi:hypothetical protein